MGPVPAYIPASAHDAPPYFGHIPKAVSDANLRRLRRNALLDEDAEHPNAEPEPVVPSGSNSNMSVGSAAGRTIASSIAQQEKEFQKAVQPGSPISALLSSARQPLLVSATTTGSVRDRNDRGGEVRDSPMFIRKLQAAQRDSPLRRVAKIDPDGAEDEETRARKKELESQKARIVAQMAPVREEDEDEDGGRPVPEPMDNRPKGDEPAYGIKEKAKDLERRVYSTNQLKEKERENVPPLVQTTGTKLASGSSVRSRLGTATSSG